MNNNEKPGKLEEVDFTLVPEYYRFYIFKNMVRENRYFEDIARDILLLPQNDQLKAAQLVMKSGNRGNIVAIALLFPEICLKKEKENWL